MNTYEQRTENIQQKVKDKKRIRNIWVTIGTSVCTLAIVFCAVFIPFYTNTNGNVNISKYKNSEYYALIETLSKQDYLFGNEITIGSNEFDTDSVDQVISPAPSVSENTYQETTLNQVDGVIEGDIMKRSTNNIFYLKFGTSKNFWGKTEFYLTLNVYTIAQNNSSLVGSYKISATDNTTFVNSAQGFEMYLSEDATTVTVITTCINSFNLYYTCLVSLDVSDVENITETNRTYIAGEYESSRKVQNEILVVTEFDLQNFTENGAVDFDNQATFVPSWGSMDNLHYLTMDEIVLPSDITSCAYTIITKVSEGSLNVNSELALLSYTKEVAVSTEHIFITRSVLATKAQYEAYDFGKDSTSKWQYITEIACISYNGQLKNEGIATVDGRVESRYCMDEKDGILRVVTTTGGTRDWTQIALDVWIWPTAQNTNASLFCIDLSTMEIVGKVENFAEIGESVISARFDGDTAYVCTAIVNTDPVFVFDLSDVTNITYKDTGTIPGYSINLLTFGDKLLGIGYGDSSNTLKVEVYSENESSVDSVDSYTQDLCYYSTLNKAHYVDAERGLVGLLIRDYSDVSNKTVYLLLQFDGTQLNVVLQEDVDCSLNNVRTFFDNGLYVVTDNETTPVVYFDVK